MDENKVKYAIGDQDFKSLRENGFLYVDKTRYIETILEGSKYYFLARPRRFGKSLFLSTLRYFYEGKRELFKGLYIDSTDWDWEAYPVLHLDLNRNRFKEKRALDEVLSNMFNKWEKEYGVESVSSDLSTRFGNIIEAAHMKTERQVVILVDEYDKPLVSNLRKSADFEVNRSKLASVYTNFKSSAEHIKLVFMSGISRFSKLSVFSDLNNLDDISFDNEYADICGITEKELREYFQPGLNALAEEMEVGYDEVLRELKRNYDGYRFAKKSSDIYNPWSVLSAMSKRDIRTYWISTGTTSVIAEALQGANVDIKETLNADWDIDDLAGLDLLNADPTGLLYQAGYLTIASYDRKRNTVRLKVPNEEIRKGLFKGLLEIWLKPERGTAKSVIDSLVRSISVGKPGEMMKSLRAYFAGVPYDLKMDNENNFHNAFYILVTLLGFDVTAEAHTSDGRIDLLIETEEYVYVIELKYDGTAEEALRQIEEKEYALKFDADSRKVFKIGVNFSSEKRCIEDWIIQ